MNGWLRTHSRPAHPRVRLLCFPHAGGSANYFRPWRTLVPSDVELVAVQYPGRHDRFHEQPMDEMDDLVRGLLTDLEELGDLPAVFLGHSMGAAVAFEATRRLSWKPELLIVSARPAPNLDRRTELRFASDSELIARLEKLGGLPFDALAEPELRDLVMPTLRADYHLIETYRPEQGARVGVAVLAVAGDRDPEVSVADVRAWQHATTAGFTLEVAGGDHFYINQHAQMLIEMALRRVGRAGGGAVT
jgi:pyochelin biosynthesis protein PchC